jgi:nucleoside-diphosphate-sugar epimerase
VTSQTLVVTGASGFCGSDIATAAHRAGYAVVCVGRRPGPVGTHVYWDARSDGAGTLLDRLRSSCASPVAAVVHCAAAVGDFGPDEWFERVNVGGTSAVLESAAALDAPAVVVSSGSVYDHRIPTAAITEAHAQGGWVTAYGRTKAAADAIALAAGARVLRPHAVYGPGDRHLLPRVTAAVRAGQLVLPGPDVTLSVTHVRTLTSAALAAPRWGAGAYNIADTAPVSRDWLLGSAASAALRSPVRVRHLPARALRSLAGVLEGVAQLTSRDPVLTRYAVDQLAHPFVLDTAKARAQGWTPSDDVDEHLARLRRARGREESRTG